MKKSMTVNLTGAALCIALGLILPVLFHMVGAGSVFLPMHIPVLLCGLLFGWQYGAVCGLIVPLLSSLLTGMPPIFPTAAAMMLELCAYGLLTGLFYRKMRWNVYPALICAMLGGRVVSGAANAVFLGMADKPYGFAAFLSASFVQAVPGIIIQIVFIPVIVLALEKASVFRRERA
ncbi:ECF transporter S component [Caproiciproducens sp. NJN-50]|uniref:ECF transporter S component n=1 Tax=Acutalibacteraceae TaxID=3082771 RepID=UPI000FFE0149|nr:MULTISPECIES: ECF transporter S component [Acutalibacteraceae]QAT48315.1 ECF transporter S component [Caproiciproducens sp. NJN-50]